MKVVGAVVVSVVDVVLDEMADDMTAEAVVVEFVMFTATVEGVFVVFADIVEFVELAESGPYDEFNGVVIAVVVFEVVLDGDGIVEFIVVGGIVIVVLTIVVVFVALSSIVELAAFNIAPKIANRKTTDAKVIIFFLTVNRLLLK